MRNQLHLVCNCVVGVGVGRQGNVNFTAMSKEEGGNLKSQVPASVMVPRLLRPRLLLTYEACRI